MSLGLHILVLLLLVLKIGAFPHKPVGAPGDRPISITVIPALETPDDMPGMPQPPSSDSNTMAGVTSVHATASAAAGGAPTREKALAAPPTEAAAPAETEAPLISEPSQQTDQQESAPDQAAFNPFAEETTTTVVAAASPSPSQNQLAAKGAATAQPARGAPSSAQVTGVVADSASGAAPGGAAGGMLGGGSAGRAASARPGSGADPSMRPQYVMVRLRSGIGMGLSPELHNFLTRLIACGVRPLQVKNPTLFVQANLTFTPDGRVASATLTNGNEFPNDPDYGRAADRLMRAVSDANCTYFTLPLMTYRSWQSAQVSFYQLH